MRRLQEGDKGGTESSIRVSLRSVFFSFLLLVNSLVFHDAESRCRHAVLKLLAKRGPGNKPRTPRGLRSVCSLAAERGGRSQYRCRCWRVGAGAGAGWRPLVVPVASVPPPPARSCRYPNSTTLHATRPACTLQPHRPTDTPHATATRAPPPTRQGARAGPGQAIHELGASWTSPAAHKRTLVRRTSRTWYGTSSRSSLFALTKSEVKIR
jgi:hypothetical protein